MPISDVFNAGSRNVNGVINEIYEFYNAQEIVHNSIQIK